MGNTIIIHGRLTRDPEQKTFKKKDGSAGTLTTFCVACDAKFGDFTYYFDCSASGKTGELVYTHLNKGSEVLVYGEMVYRDKDNKRFYNVNVDRFEFCGSKTNGSSTQAAKQETLEDVAEDTPW